MRRIVGITRPGPFLAELNLSDGSKFQIRGSSEAFVTNTVSQYMVGQEFISPATSSAPPMFIAGREPSPSYAGYRAVHTPHTVANQAPVLLNQQQLNAQYDPELDDTPYQAPVMNWATGEIEFAGGGSMPNGGPMGQGPLPPNYFGAAGAPVRGYSPYSPTLNYLLENAQQPVGYDPELEENPYIEPVLNFDERKVGATTQQQQQHQQQQQQRQATSAATGDPELDYGEVYREPQFDWSDRRIAK